MLRTFLAGFFILMLAVSCSRDKIPHNEGKYMDSPRDQIESFENALKVARINGVDTASPKDFEKAIKFFEEAKDLARKGDDLYEFHESMHHARVHLDRAADQAGKTLQY